jgi:thiamine pyrophosphokinase
MKSALVICNGEPPSRTLVHALVSRVDVVVAADGGANIAHRYRIRPDIIIGDFDSIRPATRRAFSASEFIHVTRQDNTDLEKTLDYLKKTRIKEVSIVGATGRRIDFTLGNLSVIWNYTGAMHIAFVGDEWTAIPVRSRTKLKAKPGTTVSLIPFGPCHGITLNGLKYPLRNASMRVGEIGVSNVVIRTSFSVKIRKGKMLLLIMDRIG